MYWDNDIRNNTIGDSDGTFDMYNYRKIERLARRFQQDPSYKAKVKRMVKAEQRKAQAELGRFSSMDYMNAGDLSSYEGLNANRSQIRQINLKNYNLEVEDADTIILKHKFLKANKPISVRLAGIDAPETSHKAKNEKDPLRKFRIKQNQPLGKDATDALRNLIRNSGNLKLFVDPTQSTYGRYLGVVMDSNKNINLQLVREGKVSSLEFGSQTKSIVDMSKFMAEGELAERQERGIWSHQFFKNWKMYSAGQGRDLTFNSLTDAIRLAENKAMGVAAGFIWGEGESSRQLFALGQASKAIYEGQQLSKTGLTANFGANPVNRREDQNTIIGMQHGWYGRLRGQNTPFGSAFRIGDQEINALREVVQDSVAFDIETKSLTPGADSTIQIGISAPNEAVQRLNVLQTDKSYRTKFSEENVIKVIEGEGFSFEKAEGPILQTNNYKGRGKVPVVTRTLMMEEALAETERILESVRKNRPILIQNARFEIAHFFKRKYGVDNIDFSENYKIEAAKKADLEKADRAALMMGELSYDDYIDRRIQRQGKFFKTAMQEKKILDTQEIAKTLNAAAQQAGLIAKTGKVEVGSSLDFFTRAMFGAEELHAAGMDAYDTRRVADEMLDMIGRIGKLDSNKPVDVAQHFTKAQQGWLKAWGYGSKKSMKKAATRIIYQSEIKKIRQEIEQGGDVSKLGITRGMDTLGESGINIKKIHEQAMQTVMKETGYTNSIAAGSKTVGTYSGKVNKAALVLGGVALTASMANAFLFSGRDDNYNTIEGLHHGGFRGQRNMYSDFGSGYRMENFHNNEPVDPIPASYIAMGGLAAGGIGAALMWNNPTNIDLDSLKHLGKLDANRPNSEVMGRQTATFGEVMTASVKRAEQSLGGIFRVFGIGDQMMISVMNNMEMTMELLENKNNQHIKLLHEITNRDLMKEGFIKVKIKNNKMKGLHPSKGWVDIDGFFHSMPLYHNMDLSKTPTQGAQSYMKMMGVRGLGDSDTSFIIAGGKNRFHAMGRRAHAYLHESIMKGMKVLDQPLGALAEMFPSLNDSPTVNKINQVLNKVPGLGTGGNYEGTAFDLLKRHGARIGIAATALYLGYGTLDWLIKEITPGDNIVSQGGVAGVGAGILKTAHMTYASVSEMTGLTSLREGIEDMAPGTEGWKTALGMSLSGGLAGATLASIGGLADEIEGVKSGTSYETFINNKKALEEIDIPVKLGNFETNLNRVPGLRGEYSKVGRYGRLGMLAGAVLGLPFLVSGLGSSQTTAEWASEYAGETEVAVRKGRFWEGSMSPWEGDQIAYYRPNWYARLKDQAANTALYDGENISPIGKMIRSFFDPYWLERQNYAESPYPFTGPDGSSMGMLGPLYEMTIGRALKAPTYINREQFLEEYYNSPDKYPVSEELGGIGKIDPRDPSSLMSGLRRTIHTFSEGLGFRGFAASSMFEKATGENNVGGYTPELESAAGMDSLSRAFWDLQVGGGAFTTEALRRLMPRERVGDTDRVNPMKNAMPSWLPGDESSYHTNFQRGDAFAKIKEGYYRLPGQGYATRFKELEGVDPEDYPDIYKYKILADVAPYSNEFKQVRGRLQNRELSEREAAIFSQTEAQMREKADSSQKFRDPAMYDSVLGSYTAGVTDFFRGNPVEQLLPFSPARKFLPGVDAMDRYEELVYGKDFQDWKNPLTDFIRPAITMTGDLVGQARIPEEVQYARELEDYFDKLKYIKSQRLAQEAQERGDSRGAGFYRGQADRTLIGLDPYMDANEIMRRIPKRERAFFQRFLAADAEGKEEILNIVPKGMQDIYIAQWDKQAMMANPDDEDMAEELASRARSMRARRRAEAQQVAQNIAPKSNWIGWRKDVDLEDVKLKHLINEGRDYHYYGLWKDRVNLLGRKPYIDDAVEDLNFSTKSYSAEYQEAMQAARDAGMIDPDVIVKPSIHNAYDINIQADRREERHERLRDLGYAI